MDRYFVTYLYGDVLGVTIAKEKPLYKDKDTVEVSLEDFKKITKELGSEYLTPDEMNATEIGLIRDENARLIKDVANNQMLIDILQSDFADMLKSIAQIQNA